MQDPVGPTAAARRLGVSTRTVQRWLREGKLPAVRVGSRLKVDAAALNAPRESGSQAQRRPILRLLVANRGELVARIARTCRRLGVRCLALVPQDQAGAWWTSAADEIVPLSGSYLDGAAVLAAARAAGADALHPGYGFLAENANFAQDVLDAGLTWVGPPPAAMRALGDKAAARRLAAQAGVPILPGYDGEGQSDAVLRREARRIGYPLLLKPSAGGGGKGMHVVASEADLPALLEQARREARSAFADDRLVLERHLARPRHVEVQLLCDQHGRAVHLGERECSLQRRHQKVIEEAPSVAVDGTLRSQLGAAALSLARAAGYEGAGTAEFLLDEEGAFYFLELNARLQVEHPVTELVTGRDLVADQLRIAAGEPLEVEQEDVRLTGHAIEARLYAEDAWAGFLPAAGRVLSAAWPAGEGVRVDAGVGVGDMVGTRYDPLLAKIIAHGRDREQALARLDDALAGTSVLGLTTNRGFLRWLLALPEVRQGDQHTELIDHTWRPADELPAQAWPAAAAAVAAQLDSTGQATVRPGFRLNGPPVLRLELEGEVRRQVVPAEQAGLRWVADEAGGLLLELDGRALRVRLAEPPSVEAAVRSGAHESGGSQPVTAAMPGVVLSVHVKEGESVEAGRVLAVLEAMKMENAVSAPGPGVVRRVLVSPGQSVQRADVLIELD
ncbi:MAG TPA: biotin carboxylase N-terminal domain-containing protein [Candidatus Limnocylindria bacterium]|nr:biotin carboxylase N-terminal domain-containing protein [Candidatus Limnocylindria bacterium]